MSRPEVLFPLFAPLESLEGVGPKMAAALAGLGVERPKDLLLLAPHSIIDRRLRSSVEGAELPAVLTLEVEVLAHHKPMTKGRPWRVVVRDTHAELTLVFFHARGEYLAQSLPIGARRIVSGRVERFDHMPQMVHPDHILARGEDGSLPDLPAFEPHYPLTAGVTQKGLVKAVRAALARAPQVAEWIDPALLAREGWPSWRQAVELLHNPQNVGDISHAHPVRARLAYDELFAHQLTLSLARQALRKLPGRASHGDGSLRAKVLAGLPFAPTGAQSRAIAEIAADLALPERMNRLLQGDVGAGKTLVALMALLVAVEAGGQGVMMAPTEILARQHFEGLEPLAKLAGVTITLLTGRDKGGERTEKLRALREREIDILVGTHAVFQKDVEFNDLRLAVIDEQHRFGVTQRMELGAKGEAVDVLVMTATPIPRSLALASYGDMDISVLDEKPPGRKPIKTVLLPNDRLGEVVNRLASVIAQGQRAYWVCPLVEESEALDYISAQRRYESLVKALGPDVVALVHGQMPAAEKDAAMADFIAGRRQVLVATTVIEVGVNVPEATIMVIERAETFGLAQLHQLRGRVGRGAQQSSCVMVYQSPLSVSGERRLKILRESEDGFRIAEEDLAMRGAGDLIGTAQSGLPRFKLADPEKQAGLMAVAQSDARSLLVQDPSLRSPRGQAARVLMWLLDQDRAIRLLTVG